MHHAAFLCTINPDTNKITKHVFQGYLNIYNNYFKAPWMPDRTEANPNELNFFFSSKRRHTRSLRDWSSDVCSSDLVPQESSARHISPDDVDKTDEKYDCDRPP